MKQYTQFELNDIVMAVLNTTQYTPDDQLGFCSKVKTAISERTPGTKVEVYFRGAEFHVNAWSGETEYKMYLGF